MIERGRVCLCLGRVSTKGQAGPDKVSLGQQAEATRAFALALGQEHGFSGGAVELREDPGVSGLDPARLEEIVVACEGARRPKSARFTSTACASPGCRRARERANPPGPSLTPVPH